MTKARFILDVETLPVIRRSICDRMSVLENLITSTRSLNETDMRQPEKYAEQIKARSERIAVYRSDLARLDRALTVFIA